MSNQAALAAAPDTSAERKPRADWLTGRRVVQIAAVLIGLQLVLRAWVAANGYLYWDDFILAGRSARFPLFSGEFLLYDHDGHFMPAGFLLTGLLTRLAPLEWWPMAVALVALQAVASLSVWRLLRVLLGRRPVLLVPLVLVLFAPLTVPSFTWWSAALNALPLQAGLAWVVADAVQLYRTGRARYAVSGTLALVATLTFFEKAVIVPVVAFAVVALVARNDGALRPILSTARRCAPLWVGSVLVLGGWAWMYATVAGTPAVAPEDAGTVPQAIELVARGLLQGLLPSLVGGPLAWDQIYPGTPYATPSPLLIGLGCLLPVVAVVWTARLRRGGGVIWWLVGGYIAVSAAAMVVARSGRYTPEVLPQTLRYFADTIVIVAIAIALVVDAPPALDRESSSEAPVPPRRGAVLAALILFLGGSVWSTVDHVRTWADSVSPAYLATARASLAAAPDRPLLDQEVPEGILWPLARPDNYASHVFAPLEDRPEFGPTTSELRMLDEDGRMVDGHVDPARWIEAGPTPGCGHVLAGRRDLAVPLDGPLYGWGWTVQLNYLADRDGVIDVALDRRAVQVPVSKGPNSVYVQLAGGGDTLHLTSETAGLALCVDSGVVGLVAPGGS